MPQLNISQARKLLNNYGVLIIDQKHARFLKIIEIGIKETDLIMSMKTWYERVDYFKKISQEAISNKESRIEYGLIKSFYKKVLIEVKKQDFNNLVIMCPEEDIIIINELLTKNLKSKISSIIKGNYIKSNTNQILKKILDYR